MQDQKNDRGVVRKATDWQRRIIDNLATDEERRVFWKSVGFTRYETQAMLDGGTATRPANGGDGVWYVGSVPYYQAIDKVHARRLHIWNFGETKDKARLIRTDSQGLKQVIGT